MAYEGDRLSASLRRSSHASLIARATGSVTKQPRACRSWAACQDPKIPRFIPYVPLPYRQQDGKTWLAQVERKWQSSDERTFAIVDQESNRFLGAVAIRLRDGGSIGYWLSREARGKGVMSEAVGAIVEWARTEHGIERLYIVAHPDNVASQRVAEKAGFIRTGITMQGTPYRDGTSKAVRFDRA